MQDNKEKKNSRYKVAIPPKAGPIIAIVGLLIAILTYILAVPFNFVFISGGREVYRQESVGVLANFERNAAEDAGGSDWEKVYGEKKLSFSAEDGENEVLFESNYSAVKKFMMRTAIKNLFTFSWSEEDYTIEFFAK